MCICISRFILYGSFILNTNIEINLNDDQFGSRIWRIRVISIWKSLRNVNFQTRRRMKRTNECTMSFCALVSSSSFRCRHYYCYCCYFSLEAIASQTEGVVNWITGSIMIFISFFDIFVNFFVCGCVSFLGILILQSSPFIPPLRVKLKYKVLPPCDHHIYLTSIFHLAVVVVAVGMSCSISNVERAQRFTIVWWHSQIQTNWHTHTRAHIVCAQVYTTCIW